MHTTASDGELAPSVLINRASEANIECLAITDHDTIEGYNSVCNHVPAGMRLVSGAEFSCVWGGMTIHIVGLAFRPNDPQLSAMLALLAKARRERAAKIAERLDKRNFPGALDGATQIAGDSQIGRPHFAQWMVNEGHVPDVNTAFDKYLGQGKLGDVKTFWPALKEAVAAIVGAGGVAVLAHPLKYRLTRMKLNALCQDFADAGGRGIEVLNGRQTDDETARLKRLAGTFGLQVSLGSDFHRDWQYGVGLGVDAAIAGNLPTVWEDF